MKKEEFLKNIDIEVSEEEVREVKKQIKAIKARMRKAKKIYDSEKKICEIELALIMEEYEYLFDE